MSNVWLILIGFVIKNHNLLANRLGFLLNGLIILSLLLRMQTYNDFWFKFSDAYCIYLVNLILIEKDSLYFAIVHGAESI